MKFAAEPIYPGPIDQRTIERRDDVLVYDTGVLEADLELTGPLEMLLYASSSARDTDFTAKLVDVYPDGRAIHISEGILRARHRKSLESVEFLQPGEVDEFRIAMAPTSNVFRRGHRVRLEISSSNFPRFDRNLNTGGNIGTETRWQIAHQTVMHNGRYASHLLAPVIDE
jgi:putative CocE/NonD family hydrolase